MLAEDTNEQSSGVSDGAAQIIREVAQSAGRNVVAFVHETADKLKEKVDQKNEEIREELQALETESDVASSPFVSSIKNSSKAKVSEPDSKEELGEVSGDEPKPFLSPDKKKIFLQVQLAALSGASPVLKYKALLWMVLVLFSFILLKFALRLRRRRG